MTCQSVEPFHLDLFEYTLSILEPPEDSVRKNVTRFIPTLPGPSKDRTGGNECGCALWGQADSEELFISTEGVVTACDTEGVVSSDHVGEPLHKVREFPAQSVLGTTVFAENANCTIQSSTGAKCVFTVDSFGNPSHGRSTSDVGTAVLDTVNVYVASVV